MFFGGNSSQSMIWVLHELVAYFAAKKGGWKPKSLNISPGTPERTNVTENDSAECLYCNKRFRQSQSREVLWI